MRLVYLCADVGIPYGGTKGAAVHTRELTSALAEQGAELLVLVTRWGDQDVQLSPGVELELLPGPDPGAGVAERVAAETQRAAWLGKVLRGFNADALYERFSLHGVAGSIAARSAEVPHVVEVNSPLPAEAARYRTLEEPAAAHRMERQVMSDADAVLVVSGPLVSYVRQRGARRVLVVPNAVDPRRFDPVEISPGALRPAAAFLGSLRPWHGLEVLAEAWRLLGADVPQLLVVGDGPGRELLESIGAEITGEIPYAAVPGMLARTEIGLAPYPSDAPRYFSPLKLFDYLAAGLAVVASALPGVADVVGPEQTILVPPGHPHLLAQAVAALAENPARRANLGKSGRAFVEAHHTWSHRAQTVLSLIGDTSPTPRVATANRR